MGASSRASFEIPFSNKLFSGSRRNFEDGCQDSRQLLLTSHPGERQFFLSPHAENVVYLALEVLQYISYRISLLTPVTSFLFVCFFFYCCWRIFALKLHVKTTAPASRDLQENDIDVYVRLDSLATTVRKVTLKMIEMNFSFYFNTVVYCFRGFKT